jgi:hypothetical protein
MYNKGFLESGAIGMAVGALIGQLFEMKYVKANLHYGTWN